MRCTRVTPRLALAGLLGFALPAAAADPPPIPFDAKKAQALRDQERAWLVESTLGAYKAVGKRSPAWDQRVEKAMQANVERRTGPFWIRGEAATQASDLIRQAVDARCDDPLVRYYAVRFSRRPTDATTKREYREAARTLAASKYPDIRKAHAWLNAVAELQFAPPKQERTEADLKAAHECLDELLKLLPVVAKDRKNRFLRKEVFELCDLVHRNGHDIGRRKEWFDRLDKEVLAKLPKDDPLPDLVAGTFLVKYAWDARGSGLASTVTEEGWRLFKERLNQADERLRQAWELDKQNAEAAALQITVCTGLGYDRDIMEVWFRRAVEADPNNQDAFSRKVNYLQPKWHGSPEEMLAFARQVVGLGRWDTSLPLLLTQAHYDLGASSGKFAPYFREQPEVWNEIGPVLEEIRKRYPKSPLGASEYLYYAWVSDRNPTEAHEYARPFVNALPRGRFRNQEEINAAREWAAQGAEKAKKK